MELPSLRFVLNIYYHEPAFVEFLLLVEAKILIQKLPEQGQSARKTT